MARRNGTARLFKIREQTSILIDNQGPYSVREKVGETTWSNPLLIIRLRAIVIEGDRVQGSLPEKRTMTYFKNLRLPVSFKALCN